MHLRAGMGVAGRRNVESGFSLVEVMAALAILAIALTAVFATFVTQQKSFTTQSRVAEMQQNLRGAVDYVTRDLRMAGYGIPVGDNVTIPSGVVATGVTSLHFLYAKDNTTGPDQVYLLYLFDMDANQPPTRLSAAMPTSGDAITVDNVFGFDNGDLILISDNTATADLFQITGTPAGGTLPHDSAGFNAAAVHNSSWPGTGYLAPAPPYPPFPATVAKAHFARYYIDSTSDPAHPTLMVDRMNGQEAQPLADDIEDMQLTYGLDADGDGVVDNPDPSTWISSPTYTQLAQVRQIRLMLLARSRLPDREWSEVRPALANHPAAATADGYRRRIIDVVIDVRNSGV
jgi:type IV pilus assembly protein PilW